MATVAMKALEREELCLPAMTGLWECAGLLLGLGAMHHPASAGIRMDFPDSEASGCRAPLVMSLTMALSNSGKAAH